MITLVFLLLSPNHMVDGLMLIICRGEPSSAERPHGKRLPWKNSSSYTHTHVHSHHHYLLHESYINVSIIGCRVCTLGCRQAWICVLRSVVTKLRISGIFMNMDRLLTWIWQKPNKHKLTKWAKWTMIWYVPQYRGNTINCNIMQCPRPNDILIFFLIAGKLSAE